MSKECFLQISSFVSGRSGCRLQEAPNHVLQNASSPTREQSVSWNLLTSRLCDSLSKKDQLIGQPGTMFGRTWQCGQWKCFMWFYQKISSNTWLNRLSLQISECWSAMVWSIAFELPATPVCQRRLDLKKNKTSCPLDNWIPFSGFMKNFVF